MDTKIFIHFDKNHYRAGDTIWFKIYVLDGHSHKPKIGNEIVYVDLFDNENQIVETKIVRTIKGFGDSNVKLSLNLKEGTYTARAYTRQIIEHSPSLIFEKSIMIGAFKTPINSITDYHRVEDTSNVKLFFFPEGNTISDSSVTKIGVKSLNKCGLGISVDGEIRDEENNLIVVFTTSKSGLGSFSFLWDKARLYTVWIRRMEKMIPYDFQLESLVSDRFSVKLIEYPNDFRVNLESSDKQILQGLSLRIRQREGLIALSEITRDESTAIIKIPKQTLSEGIFLFELLDSTEVVLLKRMGYYSEAQKNEKVTVISSKSIYRPGDTISLNILADFTGQGGEFGNASLSVFKKNPIQIDYHGWDIKRYVLLDSELMDHANQFLTLESGNEKRNIESILLTHKWRRNFHKDFVSLPASNIETGITIRGILKKPNGEGATGEPIELTYKNDDEIGYETKVTDALGQFVFSDLQFLDTTSVRLRYKSTRDYNIEIEKLSPLQNTRLESLFTMQAIDCLTKTDLRLRAEEFDENKLQLVKSDTIALREVEIKGRKTVSQKKYNAKRILYASASQTLDFENLEELTNPLLALSGRVPGLTYRVGQDVFLRSPNSINGSEGALLLLDGSPVSDINAIESLSFANIDFIDVLKGFQASIFGSAGVNGVIAIYTKSATTNGKNIKTNSRNHLTIIHPGFAGSKNFDSDNVESKDSPNPTIFWHPSLTLDQGKSTVSFKAPMSTGIFDVVLQGISNVGTPIYAQATIQITN
ncbi:MAG: TonB-dependent receptor plug domain-containing protein [Bacteroidota bacterium]